MDQSLISSPRHKFKATYLRIRVFEITTQEQIRDLIVNIGADGKKDWLFDLVLWATLNNKLVQVSNKVDPV